MPLALLFAGSEKSSQQVLREARQSNISAGVSAAIQNRVSQKPATWRAGGILTGIWRSPNERSNSALATRHLVRPAARSIEPHEAGIPGRVRPGRKSGVAQVVQVMQVMQKLEPVRLSGGGRRTFVAEYLKRKGVLEQLDAGSVEFEKPGVPAARRKGLVESILNSVTPEEARRSLSYLDRLYRYFALVSDVPGQQKTLLLALAARNRARRSGMSSEAELFDSWLEANS